MSRALLPAGRQAPALLGGRVAPDVRDEQELRPRPGPQRVRHLLPLPVHGGEGQQEPVAAQRPDGRVAARHRRGQAPRGPAERRVHDVPLLRPPGVGLGGARPGQHRQARGVRPSGEVHLRQQHHRPGAGAHDGRPGPARRTRARRAEDVRHRQPRRDARQPPGALRGAEHRPRGEGPGPDVLRPPEGQRERHLRRGRPDLAGEEPRPADPRLRPGARQAPAHPSGRPGRRAADAAGHRAGGEPRPHRVRQPRGSGRQPLRDHGRV